MFVVDLCLDRRQGKGAATGREWNTVGQRRGSEAGQFQVARPVVEVDAVVMMGHYYKKCITQRWKTVVPFGPYRRLSRCCVIVILK